MNDIKHTYLPTKRINKLIIVSALPGAGKSTLISNFLNQPYLPELHDYALGFEMLYSYVAIVCSTDDYWFRKDGYYDWNPNLINSAHNWCRRQAEASMREGVAIVIIDNTNLNFKECKPYIDLAFLYGYEVEIIEPDTEWKDNPEICAIKNTHRVPYETLVNMKNRKESIEVMRQKTKEYLEGLTNGNAIT